MHLLFPEQSTMKIILLLLSFLYLPLSHTETLAAISQSSPAEISYQSLAKRVEQIETSDAYQLGVGELQQKIESVEKDLEAYIDANEKNVDALLLSVRLDFIEEIFVNNRNNDNQEYIKPEDKFLVQHRRLDKILALEPGNAKASYWKARLFGMNVDVIDSQGNLKKQPIDLEKAIHYAKQAVTQDKNNIWYREALAVYYITANDRDAALEVLDTEVTALNPINILLKDLDAFPLPESSVYLKQDSESYAQLQLKQKTINDFPQLRSQVFVVPMAASQLEKFFQQTWPEFSFFRQGRKDIYAQYLVFDPGLRPTRSITEARSSVQGKMGGIILSVMDIRNPTPEQRQLSPDGHRLPTDPGDQFSYVFYVNNRNVQ